MPTPTERPSFNKNIDGRLHNQRAGGAFDVKKVLGQPHTSVPAGQVIDASSMNAQEFQNPNGFETKIPIMESRLKVVQSGGTQGVSRYVKNIDTRRYSAATPFHTT